MARKHPVQSLVFAGLAASFLGYRADGSQSPSSDYERLIPMAKSYLQQGKAEAAKNLLETYLELRPTDAQARLYLGQAYAMEKDYPQARFNLNQCLKLKNHEDIAKQANQELFKLPHRFISPKQLGSLAPTNPGQRMLLVFSASWDKSYPSLNEISQTLTGAGQLPKCQILEADNPNSAAIFDLYNVSVVPTVVLLSKTDQHIIASMIGPIQARALRRLIQNHAPTD